MSQQIYYCIENNDNEDRLNEGKHNFVYEEDFPTHFACEFCFLSKDKANFKPLVRKSNGKFSFLEKTDANKEYFFEVETK